MDWQHPIVAKLAGIVQSMDDDALAQFANVGLVRRARRDMAVAAPRLVADGDAATVETGGQTVRLAPLPSNCRCNCPAAGVCRHVLVALLFVRETAPRSKGPADSGRAEILALDEAAVVEWAGKAIFRAAMRSLGDGSAVEIEEVEIEERGALRFTLPFLSAHCRWLPGGGLAGMLCSCGVPSPCLHRSMAVLSLLAREGKIRIESASPPAAYASEELLAGVHALLAETVSIGLSRVSPATVERFQTMSLSAHAADLPRLERLLAALGSGAALHLSRDSQASTAELLATAAQAEAMACALAHPNAELVGQHRSRYLEIGECELWGAGARQWRSRSGYEGLTLYFWEPVVRRWRTWTAARPLGTPGFSAKRQFDAMGPWQGCHSPREAAASRMRLRAAWRSSAGRISGRPATTAFRAGSTMPDELPATRDWAELRDQALALFGGGLREFDEHQAIVLLRPAGWGPGQYDEARQRLRRPVWSENGRVVLLTLPYTDETASAVRRLEEYAPEEGALVLGLLRLVDGALCVEPVSLIDKRRVLNLTLADEAATHAEAPAERSDDAEEYSLEEPEATGATPSAAGAVLNEALAELELAAETGLGTSRDGSRFRENASRSNALFMGTPASTMGSLADAVERAQRDPMAATRRAAAAALLRAYYVVSLARRMEVVERALAPLRAEAPMRSL